jgi:endonuclease/exonuclease/phosphatase family metal-dependent hydrolase
VTFDDWWEDNFDKHVDRAFAQEVWDTAKKAVWADVFQVVSDHAPLASREFIKLLEGARNEDGAGPR